MSYQGHIEKGMVVIDQPLPLPDGTPVRIELMSHVNMDFWQSTGFEELARRQGLSQPIAVEDLVGGWPSDEIDDGFEEVLQDWRRHELDIRR